MALILGRADLGSVGNALSRETVLGQETFRSVGVIAGGSVGKWSIVADSGVGVADAAVMAESGQSAGQRST